MPLFYFKECLQRIWLPIVKSTENRWMTKVDTDEDQREVGNLTWAPGE